MGTGTPLHARTAPLCISLQWKEWSGFFAVRRYETQLDREYTAFRNRAGLLDVSPLYKQRVRGPHADRLLDRLVPRDVTRCKVGQVLYTPWCDHRGKVIDDGTIQRLGAEDFRLTSAYPTYQLLSELRSGLTVEIEDESEPVAAMALQGPLSRDVLLRAGVAAAGSLAYFYLAPAVIAGIPVVVSRTGYTGDLGYELWVAAEEAARVWDALMEAGDDFGITPCGLDALDVVRLEAGLLLIDVEYHSARRTLVEAHQFSPFEIGLGWAVNPRKQGRYVGKQALETDRANGGGDRRLIGLEMHWPEVEALYDELDQTPEVSAGTCRDPVPLYFDDHQVGHVTSQCWSPILKRGIAQGIIDKRLSDPGQKLQLEYTVEYARKAITAEVVPRPFFDPPRKKQ